MTLEHSIDILNRHIQICESELLELEAGTLEYLTKEAEVKMYKNHKEVLLNGGDC